MTLEIDIILGNTKNTMRHLGKNTNDEDEEDDKKGGKGKAAPSANKGSEMPKFDLDFKHIDLNSVESN